jgi:putative ABC transport system permease protein
MAVILNATAVEDYGFSDPLKKVFQNPTVYGNILEYKVIGVVEDFHHSTLRKTITPYMFKYKTESNAPAGYISIRFEKSNIYNGSTLKKIKQLWSKMTNEEPFQFFFLNDELDKYYREEERTGKISLLFSILAIIIACLGLFGLTIFNTERRIREIAVRKAMGANLWHLLMIISREILGLLGISILLAWIISYLFMKNWLQLFPYNIGFTPGIYILAALAAIVIAMITVNSITLKAAGRNPVDALYHE